MGLAKKEKSRKERQGKVGDGMNNVKVKGENFYRYHRRELSDGYAREENRKMHLDQRFLTQIIELRKRSRP